MKAPKPLPRISAKKLQSLGGSVPFSSITGKRKPIAKRNPEREAKRRKRYSAKLAAYKRSETYKLVEARAGGRCEADEMVLVMGEYWALRCENARRNGARLTHHHKTYARFGGAELPEDITVLCDHHNAVAESAFPTRRRGR